MPFAARQKQSQPDLPSWAQAAGTAKKKSAPRPAPGTEKPEPLLIRIFTWYLILRAVTFLVSSLFLTGPESAYSNFLVEHAHMFVRRIPISYNSADPAAEIRSFLAGYCFFFGLLYSITAWRWIVRNWMARWALMFLSGATAFKAILAVSVPDASLFIFHSLPVGNPFPMTAVSASLLVASACINLAICLYLMFYPGVEETFERPFQ